MTYYSSYFDILSSGNWTIWNRSLKLAVGAIGQIVPTRMFIYITSKKLHKCGLGICPKVMKIHSLVSVNASSAEHIPQAVLEFWSFIILLCSREKKKKKGRRNITEDFCCLSCLFRGIKWSYFFSIKAFQFRYWIPHGSLLCIYLSNWGTVDFIECEDRKQSGIWIRS